MSFAPCIARNEKKVSMYVMFYEWVCGYYVFNAPFNKISVYY